MDWGNTFPNKQREKIMNHTMNELPFIVRRLSVRHSYNRYMKERKNMTTLTQSFQFLTVMEIFK
jgi:hypothetical protein